MRERIEIKPDIASGVRNIFLGAFLAFIGYVFYTRELPFSFRLFHFIPVSKKIIGMVLMILLPVSLYSLLYECFTKKRIYISQRYLTLADGTEIEIKDITQITLVKFLFSTTEIRLDLADGTKHEISMIDIGCGKKKFIALLEERRKNQFFY